MKDKEAIIIVSDLHVNHSKGLSPPKYKRDDGEEVGLNDSRRFLLKAWEKNWDDIEAYTKGYRRSMAINGDLVDLYPGKNGSQYLSINPTDAITNAVELIEPVLRKHIDGDLFVIRGTDYHTGGSGWAEEEIAKDLGAVKNGKDKTYSWWQLRAEFGGVKFDISHYTSMGSLPWTGPNAALRLAYETMSDYNEWGEPYPDLVIRSHMHRFADSGRNHPVRVIFTPAWQNAPAYLMNRGAVNKRPQFGSVVVLCEGGEYKWELFRYWAVRGKIWKRR